MEYYILVYSNVFVYTIEILCIYSVMQNKVYISAGELTSDGKQLSTFT